MSNFFHFFSHNFERLGLKKLIATSYKNQNLDLFSLNDSETAIKLEYYGDKNNNRVPDIEEIGIIKLKGPQLLFVYQIEFDPGSEYHQ